LLSADPVESPNVRQAEIEMVRQLARHRGGQPEALAQVIQLSGGFEEAVAVQLIDELAAAHLAAGNLDLAAKARTHLAERYPNDPLAQRSLLWLVRLYASSEVEHARRRESPGVAAVRRQLTPRMAAAMQTLDAGDDKAGSAPESATSKTRRQLALYTLHLAERAMQQIPALAEEPALAFQRAVAARQAGQLKSAQAYLSPLKHRGATDAWGQCARTEAWLENPEGDAAPKPIIPCTSATTPPRLDGVLDDGCWQRPPTHVQGPANDPGQGATAPFELWLAHDADYLYVGLQCAAMAGVSYSVDDRPRPRDGDVEAHDSVRLLLDVDRDYASWFELVVDSRGWTAERCWGDARWNPEWFVARGASSAGDAWTIEAAIPLAELSAEEVDAGTAWASFAERLPPTATASRSRDGGPSTPGPSDFGVLVFE
jgi:hypothetical protein